MYLIHDHFNETPFEATNSKCPMFFPILSNLFLVLVVSALGIFILLACANVCKYKGILFGTT